ncbi:MAG: VanZ family protein, partial [Lachnospiraceae bacterium]|nr:VanZ family protein [Lachnospiraceae bacterium]
FLSSFLIMMFTSIIFEMLQYIFTLGTSDVADVATNTLGGLIGFLLAYLALKISKKEEKMSRHFLIMSAWITPVVILGTLFIKFGILG